MSTAQQAETNALVAERDKLRERCARMKAFIEDWRMEIGGEAPYIEMPRNWKRDFCQEADHVLAKSALGEG